MNKWRVWDWVAVIAVILCAVIIALLLIGAREAGNAYTATRLEVPAMAVPVYQPSPGPEQEPVYSSITAEQKYVAPQAAATTYADPSPSGLGIEWLINRESGGNPYAENGRYKGIGQLDASYYPIYVGLTWEECRGNYDIQYQAMLGYISSRYGNVEAAVQHSLDTGWY